MRRSQAHSKLLLTVGGKPHATAKDHVAEDADSGGDLKSAPGDDEDFDREPESSGDELAIEKPACQFKRLAHTATTRSTSRAAGFRRLGVRSSPESTASKRTSPGSTLDDDDDDDEIFRSSQGSPKRRRQEGTFTNHLAPPNAKSGFVPQKYTRSIVVPKKTGKGKKFAHLAGKKKDADASTTKKPAFRGLSSRLRDRSDAADKSNQVDSTRERREPSEVISDEDDEDGGLQDSEDAECAMCGQPVDSLLREEFEDEHRDQLRGQRLNFQWQKRFCHFHGVHSAKATWLSRDYPDIDWGRLDTRMRKHNTTLRNILNNTSGTPSFYRNELKARLKPGAKGIKQTFNSGKPGASVGYYGPRGEKAMTDFILSSLSNEIRSRAAHDDLVATSGAQGGVSGFVQAVLVPHLAELLVSDDMNLDKNDSDRSQQARAIIAASAELGELIHPEAEDKIEIVDEDDAND